MNHINFANVLVKRLDNNTPGVSTFENKKQDMVDYLQKAALTDQKIKSSTMLVWIHDNSVVLGFVTITMYSINKKDLISQDNTWKQFPHRTIPAILIGQLATHKKYEGIGIGTLMLDNVIETAGLLSKKMDVG